MDLGRDEYSYKAERDHLDDATPCKCSGCGATWRYDQLGPVGDCSLTPGDPSPAGRCADRSCDTLAYPVGEPWVEAVRAAAGLAETLIEDGAFLSAADRLNQVATKLREHYMATLPPGAVLDTLRALPPLQAILAAGDELSDALEDAESTHIYDFDNGDEQPDDCHYLLARAAWEEARAKWNEAAQADVAPVARAIGVVIEGGIIQSVFSPEPMPDVRLVVIDFDVDGAQERCVITSGEHDERGAVVTEFTAGPVDRSEIPTYRVVDSEPEGDADDDVSDRFLNHYECPCGETWSDPSPSQTDDECPKCGTTCSPSESEDL